MASGTAALTAPRKTRCPLLEGLHGHSTAKNLLAVILGRGLQRLRDFNCTTTNLLPVTWEGAAWAWVQPL